MFCAKESHMQTSLAARRAGIVFSIAFAIVAPAVAGAQTTVRPRLDLTPMTNVTRTIPAALVTPAMAQNIGPGSHLIIDIPGAGTFGCTANFIWAGGAARYLGAAGHCFLPEGATATHGSGADFDSSGVVVGSARGRAGRLGVGRSDVRRQRDRRVGPRRGRCADAPWRGNSGFRLRHDRRARDSDGGGGRTDLVGRPAVSRSATTSVLR